MDDQDLRLNRIEEKLDKVGEALSLWLVWKRR